MISFPELRLALPSDAASVAEARTAVCAWAEEAGLPAEERESLRLALGEAAGNAVVHGDGREEIVVRAYLDGGDCVVEVESSGAFLPDRDPAMPEATAERGRGRALMAALVDSVEYIPSPVRTLVRMRKRMPSHGAGH
ncbi:MAG: ATP-binding protein [Armatimonadota bacterium]